MLEPISIDVWSDVACPWCYIGKRRLEEALEEFSAADVAPVDITFHSFQLDPNTPEDFDGTAAEYLARHKGIPADHARRMQQQVTQVAAGVGLEYDFGSLRPANTRKAHQLLHFARDRGVQMEAKEALMRAHFLEGRHVGRDDELAGMAAALGLDGDEFLRALRRGDYLDAVRADIELAGRLGVTGVPFFVIDGRYGVSGAQPPELFIRALEQTLADRQDAEA